MTNKLTLKRHGLSEKAEKPQAKRTTGKQMHSEWMNKTDDGIWPYGQTPKAAYGETVDHLLYVMYITTTATYQNSMSLLTFEICDPKPHT